MTRDDLNTLRKAIQIAADSNQIDPQALDSAALALGILIAPTRRGWVLFDVRSMMPRAAQN